MRKRTKSITKVITPTNKVVSGRSREQNNGAKKLWIKLSGHCAGKIKRQVNYEEFCREINRSAWNVNVFRDKDGSNKLRLEAFKGTLVLSDDWSVAITFIFDDVSKNGDKNQQYEKRYTQRYEFDLDAQEEYENGARMRIYNRKGNVFIMKDKVVLALGRKTYDCGNGRPWTVAYGKIYTIDQGAKKIVYAEINSHPDKQGFRVRLANSDDESMGKLKTEEDVAYRRNNQNKVNKTIRDH